MYDDEKLRSTLATAQRSIMDLESPPPSRWVGLGRLARWVMRRLLRFELSPQLEFDRAVREGLDVAGRGLDAQDQQLAEQAHRIDAQKAQIDQLADLSSESADGLRASVERIEGLEGFLPKLLKDIQADFAGQIQRIEGLEERLEEQSQRVEGLEEQVAGQGAGLEGLEEQVAGQGAGLEGLEEQLAEQVQRISAQMEQVDQLVTLSAENADGLRTSAERVEGLEGFLPKLLQDIHTDFAEIRAVQASLGRQIDEVGGELVANTIDVKKFRKRIDELQRSTTSAEDRVRTLEERFAPLVDLDHFDFAKAYRGDEIVIKARLEEYARSYGPVKRILDFGCGRGEFLLTCSELNIGAYGVDRDPDMISHCKLQSLEAIEGDALQHLQELPARSLDGIFSAQVVEHLTPAEIVQLIRLASEKLKRGGKIIIETINPNTWSAMRWFYLDPSHSQPVPADMLRFFLEEANFEIVDTLYSSPVAEGERLSFMKVGTQIEDSTVADFLAQNNENVQRLNDLLFGPQDYAIVAER